MVWHGVDAGQGEDRRWDVCFLLHKILSVTGTGSNIELVIDTNVLDDLSADGASTASQYGQPESHRSQSGSEDLSPFAASPAFLPGNSNGSVSDLEDDAPNQELHGFTSDDTPRPKTWMPWSYILEMAKSIAALGHRISAGVGLHAADKNGHEGHGLSQVLDQKTCMMYNGQKRKKSQKSFLFDSTQQSKPVDPSALDP